MPANGRPKLTAQAENGLFVRVWRGCRRRGRAEGGTRTRNRAITNRVLFQLSYPGLSQA
jgi:hypothetical protein